MSEVTVLPTKVVVDRNRRDEVERRIDVGFKRCIEDLVMVGGGLKEMLDEGLYLDDFKTFGEYCEGVWNITEATARRWITAFRVASNVADQNPQVEFGEAIEGMTIAAAYALKNNARPEEMGTVWSEAKKISPTPGAKAIQDVAERHSKLVQAADGMTQEEELAELQSAEGEMDEIDSDQLEALWVRSLRRKWAGLREKYQASFSEKTARVYAKIDEVVGELGE